MHQPQTTAKSAGIYLGLLVAGILVTAWLAGYFFMLKLKLNPLESSPLTILRYWLHYAEGSAMPPLLMKLVFGRLPAGAPQTGYGGLADVVEHH